MKPYQRTLKLLLELLDTQLFSPWTVGPVGAFLDISKQPPDPLNNGISTTISTGKRKISKPSTTFFLRFQQKKTERWFLRIRKRSTKRSRHENPWVGSISRFAKRPFGLSRLRLQTWKSRWRASRFHRGGGLRGYFLGGHLDDLGGPYKWPQKMNGYSWGYRSPHDNPYIYNWSYV